MIKKTLEKIINYPAEISEHYIHGESDPKKIIYNHRFRVYASVCGWIWKPVLAGTVLEKVIHADLITHPIKLVAGVSCITGTFLYGAFWSKMGDGQSFLAAYKKSKLHTIGEILKNCILGNYYDIAYLSVFAQDSTYYLVKSVCEHQNTLLRNCAKTTLSTLEKTAIISYTLVK